MLHKNACTGHTAQFVPSCKQVSHPWQGVMLKLAPAKSWVSSNSKRRQAVAAYMVKDEAIQLGIAKFGGVCNSWCHHSFLSCAQSWSQDCPQLHKHWHMTKDEKPELGVNQICCNKAMRWLFAADLESVI